MSYLARRRENGSIGIKRNKFAVQINEIEELLNCPESKDILNEIKGEDVTIFIGNTRSGKSTLVNYVIGNELKGVKSNDFPFNMTVVKADRREMGPVIGLESVSETTLPSIWSASRSGLRGKVVDAPGFEDNRGEAQDIANTFYIKEIIRNAKSVKFVLITDINDIMSQNINNFTNFFNKIHMIFPDTRILHGGIALVVSKVNLTFTVEELCVFFKTNILDQTQLQVEKLLIKYFVENKECITFFKMPTSEGLINRTDIGQSVLDIIGYKIKGIPRHVLSDVKPGISDKSKLFLLESQTTLCNGAENTDLSDKIKGIFDKKTIEMSNAVSASESKTLRKSLLGLQTKFFDLFPQGGAELNIGNMKEKLISLCKLFGIKSLITKSNIDIHIQFVQFLDQLLNGGNTERYVAKFRRMIEMIKSQFEMILIVVDTVLSKLTELEEETARRKIAEDRERRLKEEEARRRREEEEKEEEERRRRRQEAEEEEERLRMLLNLNPFHILVNSIVDRPVRVLRDDADNSCSIQ